MMDALAGFWYDTVRLVTATTITMGFSLRSEGLRNIPLEGPALLVANHESFLDPLMVGSASPRRLAFLARKTLFRNRVFRLFISSLDSVPVDQEGFAREGLQTIIERLKLGKAVLIFPEGERTWTGKMNRMKPGVHLLIKRVEMPIVPVGIAGAFEAWPRTKSCPKFAPLFAPANDHTVSVVFGRPYSSTHYKGWERERVLLDLYDRIHAVADRADEIRRKS